MTYVKQIQNVSTNNLGGPTFLTILAIVSLIGENLLAYVYNNFLTISLPLD